VLLFDGACGFCRAWIARWRSWTGAAVDYEPYQNRGAAYFELSDDELGKAVHLIETDGHVTRAAEAVLRALSYSRAWRWLPWAYAHIPGFRPVAEFKYRVVACSRGFLSILTRLFYGNQTARPTYRAAAYLFLRGLALVYLIAFASLSVQIDGLVGYEGIMPAGKLIEQVGPQLGDDKFWRMPTLCWWDSSDAFLHLLCGTGMVASLLLLVGVLPMPMCAWLWISYLSLTNVGGIFLGYQWENLLLETGLLAILLAPLRIFSRLRDDPDPPRLPLFLVRYLLFKLTFLSGYVKLASQDEVWWNLTAVQIHYWTQPIPTWTAWYMHHLPMAFQKFSCFVMFVIELGFPFLIFMPRRARLLAFVGLFGLQVVIAATGNFAYFNVLTMVLCLPLLDDSFLPRLARRVGATRSRLRWPRLVTVPVGAVILAVSTMFLGGSLGYRPEWPRPLRTVHEFLYPFRSVGSYGLFANMTENRPEIVVEGSDDGVTWKAYEFKWKPGDLSRRPGFVAPHQPRLDWQMWFAALGDYRGNPWFINFMVRLLQGSPPVLDLLEKNPFPDHPPKVVRAVYYDYYFTTPEERRETGDWWRRKERGLYCPPVQLNAE
jgi:predicted DCC family thiol-disulfide oxidoreductase YuxK